MEILKIVIRITYFKINSMIYFNFKINKIKIFKIKQIKKIYKFKINKQKIKLL